MARNKPRLCLALYARPKHPDTYHEALMICPKLLSEKPVSPSPLPAVKYHVKNTLQRINDELAQPWVYERQELPDVATDPRLLVRIVIGKVLDAQRIEEILRDAVPIYQVDDDDEEKAHSFNCAEWVRMATEALRTHGVVDKLADWQHVKSVALEYVERKKTEGRWKAGSDHLAAIATFDMLENRQTVE
ncbi:MAG: hypothetical protein M1825_002367 [Sarcosagium campestre]|nr:MAG: hypothetical protein M1825_002367 [Sarcosagium campestre]